MFETTDAVPGDRDDADRVLGRRELVAMGAAALLSSLSSCRPALADPFGSLSGDPSLESRPGTPDRAAPLGRTALGLGSGRDGFLYVPVSYDPAHPTPLFVALHGAGGRAANWNGLTDAAESRGMILLAVDSREATWDTIRGSFGPDVEFVDRALAHTFERCTVDPRRLLLGGFSDGASYALSLGLPNGDLFSHLLAFSPGFIDTLEREGRPRVFVSHGSADPVLPVGLSRDRIVPTLEQEGYQVVYEEFAGGHEIPADVANHALDWFLD